jgi:DNA-binding MarR family transcriptional regulator
MHSKSADGGHRSQLIRQLQYLGQMQSTETAHFHQTAASINGLNITDSKTLSVLMQEGPMTAGQLALRLNLTTGAITSVIDRLEAAGYADRTMDPEDRRKVIVVINHKKTALLGKTYDSIGASFTKLLGRYSTEQLEFLTGFMQSAIELSKQETYKLTGPR